MEQGSLVTASLASSSQGFLATRVTAGLPTPTWLLGIRIVLTRVLYPRGHLSRTLVAGSCYVASTGLGYNPELGL